MTLNILILGKNSQVSRYFYNCNKDNKTILDSDLLDLRDTKSIKSKLTSFKPDLIINFAAFNDVEAAENSKDSFLINSLAVKEIAEMSNDKNIPLIHISTDFVFDGELGNYKEEAKANPINKYGESKLQGEMYIQERNTHHLIIRTSWLYSSFNTNNNFLSKILSLYLQKPKKLSGAVDILGSPTSAYTLAEAINYSIPKFIEKRSLSGIYHFSNQGCISRYQFMKEILSCLESKINNGLPRLIKTQNDTFNLLAPRPKDTSLDSSKFKKEFSVELTHWNIALKKEISRLDWQV